MADARVARGGSPTRCSCRASGRPIRPTHGAMACRRSTRLPCGGSASVGGGVFCHLATRAGNRRRPFHAQSLCDCCGAGAIALFWFARPAHSDGILKARRSPLQVVPRLPAARSANGSGSSGERGLSEPVLDGIDPTRRTTCSRRRRGFRRSYTRPMLLSTIKRNSVISSIA